MKTILIITAALPVLMFSANGTKAQGQSNATQQTEEEKTLLRQKSQFVKFPDAKSAEYTGQGVFRRKVKGTEDQPKWWDGTVRFYDVKEDTAPKSAFDAPPPSHHISWQLSHSISLFDTKGDPSIDNISVLTETRNGQRKIQLRVGYVYTENTTQTVNDIKAPFYQTMIMIVGGQKITLTCNEHYGPFSKYTDYNGGYTNDLQKYDPYRTWNANGDFFYDITEDQLKQIAASDEMPIKISYASGESQEFKKLTNASAMGSQPALKYFKDFDDYINSK